MTDELELLRKKIYNIAKKYLEKSITIQREIGRTDMQVWTTAYLFLSYKYLGKKYDKAEIQTLIEETGHIEDHISYHIYLLIDDITYLEAAYNQLREKAGNLEPDIAAKFLEYPTPKAIIQDRESLKG